MQNNIQPNFGNIRDKYSGRQAAVMFLIAIFAPTVFQFVYSFIIIGIVGPDMAAINAFLDSNPWVSWVANATLQIILIAAFVIYSKKENVNMVTAARLNKKITPLTAVILAGIGICVLFAFDPLTLLFMELLKLLGFTASEAPLIVVDSWGTYITGVFAVCILPALGEELIYRGTITSGLSEYGKRTAILLTGLCFSLMHQNPEQTMHQFLLGCLLAWIFLETQSFWAPAIIHFINNFFIVTYQFAAVYYYNVDMEAEIAAQNAAPFWSQFGSSMLISAIAAPLLFALLYALQHQCNKSKNPIPEEEEKIEVSIFKLPFADELSPGKKGEDERVKEVEDIVIAHAKKAQQAGKAREKKAALTTLAAGLAFCFIMWLVVFFNVEL